MSTPAALFAFRDTARLAAAVAKRLQLKPRDVEVHRFPDGESLVRVPCDRPDRVLLFCSLDRPNEKLVEVLLAADALRRQGARQIVLVAPYLGYMRQDRVFRPGESLSQRVIARLLDSAFDRIVTVEAHLHRIERLSEIFTCRAESFSASSAISAWLRTQDPVDLIVGPDSESEPWIRAIAEEADLPWSIGKKSRHADTQVEIDLPPLPKDTNSAWIIDDIASSGATLESIARILRSRGLRSLGAIVVHALFSEGIQARLTAAGLDRVVSTDSIAHPTNEIPLAGLLADVLEADSRPLEAA